MTILEQHPLSAAFPSMPEQELQALALDIEKNGQREPGVMYEGKVLDGWHRYLACSSANVKFKTVEFDGDDPVAFVISRNLHRRHLTASQRAAAVVAAHEWKPEGRPVKNSAPGAELSAKALAEKAEVSPRTIEQAKTAHRAGLGEQVKEGKVSAKKAAELASGRAPKGDKPKVIATDPKFERLYEEVKSELVAAKEQLERQQEALDELADTDKSVQAFKDDEQFKEMQVLREELRAVKRRRDELMRENAELKRMVSYWKKKAEKK